MKTFIILSLLLLPSIVFGAEYLEQVETGVYQATGTAKEIFAKGKACVGQIVQSEKELFVTENIEGGTFTVSPKVPYRAKAIAHVVKGSMTFFAKDGKFKMRYQNLEYAIADGGYGRIGKWWRSGWKDAQKALLDLSDKVAECVKAEPKKEEW